MFSIATMSILFFLVGFPQQGLMSRPIERPPISKELGLTDAQIDSIREINYKTTKEIIPLQSQLRLKNLQLRHEMAKDNPDEKKVMALADLITGIKAQIRKENLKKRLRVQRVLTLEQKRKLHILRLRSFEQERPPMMRGARKMRHRMM